MLRVKSLGHRLMVGLSAIAILCFGSLPQAQVAAQASDCVATVTPNTMGPSANVSFNINIANNAGGDFQWIDITLPSDKFLYAGNSIGNGWSTADHGDGTTLTGSAIGVSQNEDFQISVLANVLNTGPENWNIRASTDPSGASNVSTCSGSVGTSISGHMPQDAASGISNVVVSDITTSAATISWDSDNAISSLAYYGADSEYGNQSAYDSSPVNQHTIQLTGLSAGTTYHFQVVGTDGAGTFGYSMDNTFMTVQAPVSPSSQNNSTGSLPGSSTVTGANGDSTPPEVSVTTQLSAVYQTPPALSGVASDAKGIAKVEYSTDGGQNWLPVDDLKTAGATSVTFSFKPLVQKDGDYLIVVRATDGSGNTRVTQAQKLVIDRLPPIIGGTLLNLGPQIIQPDDHGNARALIGSDQQITLSAVGGPTSIVVEAAQTGGKKGVQSFSLTKSVDTELWSGSLAFLRPGTYSLTVKAVDGAGNKTERALSNMIVDQPAAVLDGRTGKPVRATVRVYYRDSDTKNWVVWDGASYGQANPIVTRETGEYGVYLPGGTYYLKINASGYESTMTQSFVLEQPTVVSAEVKLKRAPGVRLGRIDLRVPSISFRQIGLTSKQVQTSAAAPSGTIKALPAFSLPQSDGRTLAATSLYGKPTIVTFVSTWAPPARDQLAILSGLPRDEINVIAVASGEGAAKLAAYTKIAGYELPVTIDASNQLIAQFGASNLPTAYFIDRHGDIKKVVVGVLSKEELMSNVSVGF